MDSTIQSLLLAMGILAAAVTIGLARNKRLIREGKIVKRKGSFFEEEELFVTSASFESVLDALNRTDLSGAGVTLHPDPGSGQAVLFRSKHGWDSKLSRRETGDGKNRFRFAFTAWTTRDGIPWRADTMNMMLTAVEKALLSLDPDATVETRPMQIRTKHRFI